MALTHGEAQSRAHAEAARTTSQAREKARIEEAAYYANSTALSWDAWETALDALNAAKAAEHKAYLAYTNPFGVVKTFS